MDEIENIKGWKVRSAPCMICGGTDNDELWIKDEFHYVRCCRCSTIRVDPQLLISEVSKIYSIGYHTKNVLQSRNRVASPYYRRLLKYMQRYWQSGRILDVGCFTGKFLSAAKEAKWQAIGLEISEEAVEYSYNQLGLDVRQGTLIDTDLGTEAFDIITMFDVLEHFQEPMENLKKVVHLLHPKGILYIETPNFSSIPRSLLGKEWNVFFPWHFYYFNARTISNTLKLAGFKVMKIQSVDIGPLSRFNAFASLQNYESIVWRSPAKQLMNQKFVNNHLKEIRALYHSIRNLENFPFKMLSLLGIHVGGKLVVWAERLRGI